MIITFYDKNFNALQDNASLNVGEWSLTRRAVDFDDFTATSEPFLEQINPTFVVLKDNYGRYKYGAFAGIPELTEENKTKLQASDLKTIFNSQIVTAFSTYNTLKNYFDAVYAAFNTQVVQGSFTVEFNTSNLSNLAMSNLAPVDELQAYDVWGDCIMPYLKYYDVFIQSALDIKNKKIIFTFKLCNDQTLPLRLWEFNIKNYGKYIASVNEVQAIVKNGSDLHYGNKWILTSNNAITTVEANRDIFPIKRQVVFVDEDDSTQVQDKLNEADIEALKTLVEARYQESFTIPVDNDRKYANVDLDTTFNVYSQRGVFYKALPVGEIIENNKGQKTLKVGYKPEDIVFYI